MMVTRAVHWAQWTVSMTQYFGLCLKNRALEESVIFGPTQLAHGLN